MICWFRSLYSYSLLLTDHWIFFVVCFPAQFNFQQIIIYIIKFSTSDNAFRVHGLVRSILVISSYTFVWPYMVNDFAKLTMFSPKAKFLSEWSQKRKEKRFCGKFGSMPTFRSTLKGKRCFFVMSLRLPDHKVLHNIDRIFIKFFSISLGFFSLFSLIFRTSNFWSLRNLIKQLFHSRLLDMRLVIANSALRASLAIYHLISNARSWNNC